MISSFSSLRSTIKEFLLLVRGTLIVTRFRLLFICRVIFGFFFIEVITLEESLSQLTHRMAFAVHIHSAVGKVPGDTENIFDYLYGKQPAPSTTVLVVGMTRMIYQSLILGLGFVVPSCSLCCFSPDRVGFRLRRRCAKIWARPLLVGFIFKG